MARGYYELPRSRPPPTFGPPRPKDRPMPSTRHMAVNVSRQSVTNETPNVDPIHVVILLEPGLTDNIDPARYLLSIRRALGGKATVEVIDARNASQALLQNPTAVLAPGLDQHSGLAMDSQLVLDQYVASGGQLLTESAELYLHIQQQAGRSRDCKPMRLERFDSVNDPC